MSGSWRFTFAPNREGAEMCRPPSNNAPVGKFYAMVPNLSRLCLVNRRNLPFPRFGTPIAILLASTWFHDHEGAVQRFSGPLRRPFLRLGLRSHQLLELAAFEHLHHDVGSSDKLALHIKLRDRRPIGIFLDAPADLGVLENIDGFIF